jgi:hypothetical protein
MRLLTRNDSMQRDFQILVIYSYQFCCRLTIESTLESSIFLFLFGEFRSIERPRRSASLSCSSLFDVYYFYPSTLIFVFLFFF